MDSLQSLLERHRTQDFQRPYDVQFAHCLEKLKTVAGVVASSSLLVEVEGELQLHPGVDILADYARLVTSWAATRGIGGAPILVEDWPAPATKS